MKNEKLLSSKEVANLCGVTIHTVCMWRKEGRLPFMKINDRVILHKIEDVEKLLNKKIFSEENAKKRKNIIYARVSTSKQKDDLKKQIQILNDFCNSNGIIIDEIFAEIASGINEDREEFNKIIDLVINKEIDKIYITFEDRLTRFGFKYFENLFDKFDTQIVVLNNKINNESFEEELSNDLISIIHHFSMKMYSNRRKEKLNLIKKELELENSVNVE